MTRQRRRWGLWFAVGLGVIAALTVAHEREGPKLLRAKRERAQIAAHAAHRYAIPLEARACALGTLSRSQPGPALQLIVREPGTDRALRHFELARSALEFGFCVEAPGSYVLELRSGAAAGRYELALEAVLARPAAKLGALRGNPGNPLMSPRVRALAAALPDPEGVEQFCSELARDGTPLIEPYDADSSWVSFFYLGGEATRRVSLSWQLWSRDLEETQLMRLPGTKLWWKSVRLPNTARLSYQLTIDPPELARANEALLERTQAAVTQGDPWNKAAMLPALDVYSQRSTVQLPAATPETWRDPGLTPARGRIERHSLASAQLGHAHALAVYLPPAYETTSAALPLLIFFDGDSYLRDQDAQRLLDALIAAGEIAALVALFVLDDDPSQRVSELPCNIRFAAFVADELLPFARAHYRLSQDPAQVGLAGSSLGGLASSFIALNYPDRFGKVLSQSGSFWWSFQPDSPQYDGSTRAGWLRRRLAETPVGNTQFYLSAGLFEGGAQGNGVLEENRLMRDALRARGYSVAYQELAGGHDHLVWRATLPDALIALYGAAR